MRYEGIPLTNQQSKKGSSETTSQHTAKTVEKTAAAAPKSS